jgi:hypothetical protein
MKTSNSAQNREITKNQEEVKGMNPKVRQVLPTILDKFKTGDIPQAIAVAMFPVADIPSAQWSFLNRTLMFLARTSDGRGYRQ